MVKVKQVSSCISAGLRRAPPLVLLLNPTSLKQPMRAQAQAFVTSFHEPARYTVVSWLTGSCGKKSVVPAIHVLAVYGAEADVVA